MAISGVLFAITVLCAAWATASAILITHTLDRRGLDTPAPFIGLFLFRNLRRYRVITHGESGRVGLLFYSYVISINAGLVLALVALILWNGGM